MLGPLPRIRGQHNRTSLRVPAAGRRERRRLPRRLFAVPALTALVAALLVPVMSTTASAQTNPSDWPQYLGGPSHSSYNAAATSITTAGVQAGNLQPVWRWSAPSSTNAGRNILRAGPTAVDGVVYIGADDGMFYAVSESTQKVLWSDNLGLDTAKGSCGADALGITSTAAVVTDPTTGNLTVYVYGPTGTLYALNAATGATVWTAQVDTESTTKNDYYSWGSPLVVNGHVYIGVSSDCDNPLVPAGLAEYNQSTGAQQGFWHSLATGQIGASIWSSAAEEADGTIVATTGNGYNNTGQPRWDEAVVRLNGSTLSLNGGWQIPPDQQVSDADFGASPTMFTADLSGTSTPMVGACDKNGVFYALRQNAIASGPVWQATVAIPYPGSYEECIAAAIWNGTSLIVSGGAPTTIGGKTYLGSVQALNPATGKPLWQTGIPGFVLGSPSEDGAGVVAVPLYGAGTDAEMGVDLLNASNGQIIGTIPLPKASIFAQPVFDRNDLLVAANQYLTAYEITKPGAKITKVTPATVGTNTTSDTLTLTGSGSFSGTPKVFVSGTLVTVTADKVLSPTSLSVTVSVGGTALPGPRNITVIEPGSSPRIANTCTSCLTVTAPDTTTLTSSLNPSSYGQAVTLTATVSNGTPAPPTGTVSFMNGSTTLGTGTLNSSGVATFTSSTLPTGPATIDAVYSGDSSNPTSTSNDITQAVNPALTNTTLTSSVNPATYGQSVTLTGTVTVKTGGFTPTGVVNFYDGTTFIADATLTNGVGKFTTSALPVGTDKLTAIYPGGGNAGGSPAGALQGHPSTSNTVKEVINPAATTTGLTSSVNPSTVGESVTFTATVSDGSANVPTGTVTFLNGTTTLGTGKLNSSGVATFATSALPAGTDEITASYGGDANNEASVSSALAQVVNPTSSSARQSPGVNYFDL